MYMRKVISIIGNVVLYFFIVLGMSYVFDKVWGLDVSIWEYACLLTIGWGIWQSIKFAFRIIKEKE